MNDRNFYTHSSSRTVAQLDFNEMLNVATVCKEIYRVLILTEMGMPQSLLKERFGYSRLDVAVFNSLFGIKLTKEGNLPEYDEAMWHFADTKQNM